MKVMSMSGWSELKTVQIYARKAGIDTRDSTECLNFHDPNIKTEEEIVKIDKLYN